MSRRSRQLEVAAEMECRARSLAHLTRDIQRPADVYELIGELRATLDHLSQTCAQLGRWYATADDHPDFAGADGNAVGTARDHLCLTAEGIETVERVLGKAHTATNAICWRGSD